MGDTAFIAGGFFVAFPRERESWMSATLPEQIVSASGCFTNVLSPWPRGGREPSFIHSEWVEPWASAALDDGRLLWPDVFTSPDAARELISKADLPEDVVLLGVGLPSARLELFEGPVDNSVERLVLSGAPLPDDGTPLGFEILDLEYEGFSHSWLCNGLERDAAARFGAQVNGHGLIESLEEADRIAAWVNDEAELGHTCSSGATWDPWLLIRYPAA
jgi:hypothetical protein